MNNLSSLIQAYRYHKQAFTSNRRIENTYRCIGHKSTAMKYMIHANNHEIEMQYYARRIEQVFNYGAKL